MWCHWCIRQNRRVVLVLWHSQWLQERKTHNWTNPLLIRIREISIKPWNIDYAPNVIHTSQLPYKRHAGSATWYNNRHVFVIYLNLPEKSKKKLKVVTSSSTNHSSYVEINWCDLCQRKQFPFYGVPLDLKPHYNFTTTTKTNISDIPTEKWL